MTSLLTSRSSRARLLQLPPALRPCVYAQTQPLPRRSFSASASRQLSAHDVAIAGPTAVFDAIHATGLPWWASIPIAAVLVRCCLFYPAIAAPARRRAAIRQQYVPLAQVLAKERSEIEHMVWLERCMERGAVPSPSYAARMFQLRTLVKLFQEHRRLGAMFRARLFSWTSIAQPIVFLSFGEAIRIKAGGREGLLSVILHPLNAVTDFFTGKTREPILSPDEILAARLEAAYEAAAKNADGSIPDLSALRESLASQAHEQSQAALANIDPAMLTEGLWWFQNLTQQDSTMVLPLAMGASLLLGVFNRDSRVVEPAKREVKMDDIRINPSSDPSSLTENAGNPGNAVKGQAMNDVNAALAKADEIRASSGKQRNPNDRTLIPASLRPRQVFGCAVAFAFFAMGLRLPAGALLYIIPYLVSGRILKKWNSIKHPVPPRIKPCRRPMRLKVRRKFRDV